MNVPTEQENCHRQILVHALGFLTWEIRRWQTSTVIRSEQDHDVPLVLKLAGELEPLASAFDSCRSTGRIITCSPSTSGIMIAADIDDVQVCGTTTPVDMQKSFNDSPRW